MSVGADLARARDERGLSVEDVSSATRIRAGLIRAIEADQFEPCGGAVYARGHIRSIARAVGTDPEPLVAEFDRTHVEEPAPVPVPNQPTDPDLAARADRRRPNWTGAMAAALLVICALAGYGIFKNGTAKPGTSVANDFPTVPSPSTSPTSPSPLASPPPTAVAMVPPRDAVVLIRVTGSKTWLHVETLTHRVLFSAILNHGEARTFRDAHGLTLVIGNAPAVQLVADSQDFGVPRSSGNVAHVTVKPAGDVTFV
ncbi:MAG: cytoskeleton protein RodZ [Frankiaceae bacterium]|nr:cytoskeleton protein RodZ [Frankiaceae bacterium]